METLAICLAVVCLLQALALALTTSAASIAVVTLWWRLGKQEAVVKELRSDVTRLDTALDTTLAVATGGAEIPGKSYNGDGVTYPGTTGKRLP